MRIDERREPDPTLEDIRVGHEIIDDCCSACGIITGFVVVQRGQGFLRKFYGSSCGEHVEQNNIRHDDLATATHLPPETGAQVSKELQNEDLICFSKTRLHEDVVVNEERAFNPTEAQDCGSSFECSDCGQRIALTNIKAHAIAKEAHERTCGLPRPIHQDSGFSDLLELPSESSERPVTPSSNPRKRRSRSQEAALAFEEAEADVSESNFSDSEHARKKVKSDIIASSTSSSEQFDMAEQQDKSLHKRKRRRF